jgi:flagellar hook-length control protein FliK
MNMISTTPAPAAAALPLAVGAPMPAAAGQAVPVAAEVPGAALPLFFAQFLGIEATVATDLPQETDNAPEAADDAAPAADAPPAAPAADLPGMTMLMMPPPPPALPPVPTSAAPSYGAAEQQVSTAIDAAALPVRVAPQPTLPAAKAPATTATSVAAPVAAAAADPEIASAADSDSPSAPAFSAVFASTGAAGAIVLPAIAARPVRAEQQVSAAAAKPSADALPAKPVETATRAATADTTAWVAAAPVAPIAAPVLAAAPVALEGAPQQWQQTLRDALGERLQTQVGSNSEHAVIRLDPPLLGRIEISIRHSAGALQVTLSATHGDVLRQLHTIGDSVRQQLSQQSFTEVALVVTSARSSATPSFADGGGRQRGSQEQQQQRRDEAQPGRALSDAGQPAATFAMQPERNYS